jgi:hypothetical protein
VEVVLVIAREDAIRLRAFLERVAHAADAVDDEGALDKTSDDARIITAALVVLAEAVTKAANKVAWAVMER